MFLPFFETLRKTGIPVSLREFISFLDAVQTGMVIYDLEGFYYLARTIMVKDERHLDRFDRAFQTSFKGLESISARKKKPKSKLWAALTSLWRL